MIFSGKKGSEASSDSVKVAIFPERRKRRQALSDWSDKSDRSDGVGRVGRGDGSDGSDRSDGSDWVGRVDPSNILTIITG